MYRNQHFLSVILRPAVGKTDALFSSLLASLRKGTSAEIEAEGDALERMDELLRDTSKLLGRLNPRLLKTYSSNGLEFSEVLEFLQLVMRGQNGSVPVVRGHLGSALYNDRLIFGREVIEIREPGSSRYAGIIGVREHAAEAVPAAGDVPFAIRRRLISARLFDAPGNIVGSDVFEGTQLAGFLAEGFQREDVAYAHIHYARNGCFAAKAVRA